MSINLKALQPTQRAGVTSTRLSRAPALCVRGSLHARSDFLPVRLLVCREQLGCLRVRGRRWVGVVEQRLDGGEDRGHAVHGAPLVLDDIQAQAAVGKYWEQRQQAEQKEHNRSGERTVGLLLCMELSLIHI